MSKCRVPFSWVSRLLVNETLPLKPSPNRGFNVHGYRSVSTFFPSPFQFRHNQLFQARHFCVTPEETQQAVFQLLAEVEREKNIEREAKRKAGIVVDEDEEEEEDYMGVGPLIEKMEKKFAREEEKYGAYYFMDTDEESESGSEDDDDDEERAEEMRIKEEQLVERKLRRHEELIRGFIETDNLDEAFKWMAKLDKFEEKHFNPRPEYRVIGELINRFKGATGKDKFLLAQKLNRAMRLVQQREAFDPNNPANYSIIQREEVGPSVELMDDADVEVDKDTEGVEKDKEEEEEEFDDMKERDDILLQKLSAIDKKLEEKLAALDHTFGKKGKLLEEEIRDLAEERNSLTEKKRVPMYRKGFDVHLIDMNRTCKVTKGGQVVKYTAILACGNYNGVVGYAKAKGPAVPIALQKAYEKCFQNLHYIDRYEDHTIAHAIQTTYKKTKIYLWPARTTTGMKAGRTVQTILNLAGFKNIKSKVIGSRNPHNTVKALFKALNAIETPKDVQEKFGRTVVESYLL